MRGPIITLLTDFGLQDHYVAAVKGVMLEICPDATLVDITHEINSWNVAAAAYELARTWQYFPAGTVHLVVVDPGVGSARRPLLVSAAGHHFVAPDNGVLSMAVEAAPGQAVAREITAAKYFRSPVSRTFHGRDIFGPVAAHLAGGHLPEEFGPAISDIVRLPLSAPPRTAAGVWGG